MLLDDHRLLERLRAGDHQAPVEIVDRHMRDTYDFLWMLTQDRDVAADLTQETMVQAWRALGRFRGECRLSTWIKKIALNQYRQHLRRIQRRDTEVECEVPDVASPFDLAQSVVDADSRRLVRKAVAALPTIYREVVVMHCYCEAPLKDVAQALGIPLGTVKWRLSYAVQVLRLRLAAAMHEDQTRGTTNGRSRSAADRPAPTLDEQRRRLFVRPGP